MTFADAPLDPTPERAHDLLRRELLHPGYHDQNPIQQFLHWLGRRFSDGLDSASQTSPIGGLGIVVVFLVLLLLLTWLISRARTTARTPRETGAVLTQEQLTAADLRARAHRALAAGDFAEALVDGFRAVAVRQIERGWIEDQPGATAHEISVRLGAAFPAERARITTLAHLFDLVLYGDRPATREQAENALALDDTLANLVGAR